MKRAVVLSAVLSLMATGVVGAEAAPGKKKADRRVVVVEYDKPAAYYASCGDCTQVRARPDEHYVTVEVLDGTSPSGHVDVAWDRVAGDEPGPASFAVCGRTTRPQEVPSGRALALYPWGHPGPECPQSFSTSGKIKITFSTRP